LAPEGASFLRIKFPSVELPDGEYRKHFGADLANWVHEVERAESPDFAIEV